MSCTNVIGEVKIEFTEAVAQRCSVKKMFLEISKVHRKTPMLESLFNKVAGLRPVTLLKRDSNIGVFL